jgi:hypothetical protein
MKFLQAIITGAGKVFQNFFMQLPQRLRLSV